jgi:hypothetical protein
MTKFAFRSEPIPPKLKAAERYGFGRLAVGETVEIRLDDENPAKVRGHIGAHGQYYRKQFRTRTIRGSLFVTRIA